MEITAGSLIGICASLIVFMIGLLIKIVWDTKTEAREAKKCIATKRDIKDCHREMDKLEERYKDDRKA